ncbi:hypothetical protein CKO25_03220 [Thiocapsa imhoffii]|uniref:Uncharacterized protein n=2 Tax=Thiocapsa imhoffii TaxID=382777 RepID=A0A9X1B883_9GAMM|nr:hypothetical protein [Thiocapsa imhoffii]
MTPGVAVAIQVEPEPIVTDARRIGINLGTWNYWGAEQFSRNIIKNPGFEGLIDRALVRVSALGRDRFHDDQRWLGRDDGFWSGAQYEVLTGSAAGAVGTILDSLKRGRNDLPEFTTLEPLPSTLAVGDIVTLTHQRDDLLPTHWWLPRDASGGVIRVVPGLTAPDSPGHRSLLLAPFTGKSLRIASHLDTIGSRTGNHLLPVSGPWQLRLWVHAEDAATARLRILFRRHGSQPFLNLTVQPKAGWQLIEQTFEANDEGPIGALELALEVTGPGALALDDLWLGPLVEPADDALASSAEQRALEAFRPEVIAVLRELNPGYLRDWQGQLGDRLENRLAEPWARRMNRYRPAHSGEFSYGLPEFLDLSEAVGADPWLVMPTTFSIAEAEQFGVWLAARLATQPFNEVLIEFGNENWNAIFRPGGIQDPLHHGAAADRLFTALKAGAGEHPALRLVVNAQHANPYSAGKVAQATSSAEILAVAPYVLSRLNEADREQALEHLFADDGGRLAEIRGRQPAGQELAVYEVNLHTTRGDINPSDRAAITTGAATGSALAKRLLEALALGARRQCVYSLAGFDTKLEDQNALVPLFGVTRDLTRGDRLRPNGWAMAMLNQVIGGDLHRLTGLDEHSALTIAPFLGPHGWSVAIASSAAEPRRLTLSFPVERAPGQRPTRAPRPAWAQVLDASQPFANNETSDQVRPAALPLHAQGLDRVRVVVPPYSLVVMGPPEPLP